MDIASLSALPFFLSADEGERFCLYYEPEPGVPPRGAVLYVPPFAEELNKSRRMVALQARAYAQAGFGVLQIDLYGCGDSSGELSTARWDIWLGDLAHAWQWLAKRNLGPRYLWGLRLGALLALDFATRARPDGLILWQPALSGRAHLNQFARLQSAARLFAGASAVEQDTEIAGYLMEPALSAAINQLDAGTLTPRCPVQWMELSAPPAPASDGAAEYAAAVAANALAADDAHDQARANAVALPGDTSVAGSASTAATVVASATLQPASALLIERWRSDGARIDAYPMHGEPFWSSAEIGIVPELLSATSAALALPLEAA
ncbi:hydrolase 2, exosortase A system-associated [Duganella sp. PWIR1]